MNTQWDALEDEIVALYSASFALDQKLLTKIREFDESEEWSRQSFVSCAHWLSFRVGLSLHTARERVRVARALKALPVLNAKLQGGEISFSKVRELSRVATPETEVELLALAEEASGEQVKKFATGLVQMDRAASATVEDRRACRIFFADDGMCVVSARLRPEEGALLMKAIEASRQKGQTEADALVAVAERSLLAKEQCSAERYQVVVHTQALLEEGTVEGRLGERAAVPAGTLQRLACDSSTVVAVHDSAGAIIDVGRKTRRISTKLRLALSHRDGGCQYPGCTNRFVDAHHVKHWADGGETNLANLISLCGFHHGVIHDGKARLGEDHVFRRGDGNEITNELPRKSAPPTSRSANAIKIPSGHPLDYSYASSLNYSATSSKKWVAVE